MKKLKKILAKTINKGVITRNQEITERLDLDIDFKSFMKLDEIVSDILPKAGSDKYLNDLKENLTYMLIKTHEQYETTHEDKNTANWMNVKKMPVMGKEFLKENIPETWLQIENTRAVGSIMDEAARDAGNAIFQAIESTLSNVPAYDKEKSTPEVEEIMDTALVKVTEYAKVAEELADVFSKIGHKTKASQLTIPLEDLKDKEKLLKDFKKASYKKMMALSDVIEAHATFNGLALPSMKNGWTFDGENGEEIQLVIDLAKDINTANDVLSAYDITEGKDSFIHVAKEGNFKTLNRVEELVGLKGKKRVETLSSLVGQWCPTFTKVFTTKSPVHAPFSGLDSKLRFMGVENNLAKEFTNYMSQFTLNRGDSSKGNEPVDTQSAIQIAMDEKMMLTPHGEEGHQWAAALRHLMKDFVNKDMPHVDYRLFPGNSKQFADAISESVTVHTEKDGEVVKVFEMPIKGNKDQALGLVKNMFQDDKYEIMAGGNTGVCFVFKSDQLGQYFDPTSTTIEVTDIWEKMREEDPLSAAASLMEVYAHETTHLAQIGSPAMYRKLMSNVMKSVVESAIKYHEDGTLESSVSGSGVRTIRMGGVEKAITKTKRDSLTDMLAEYASFTMGQGEIADQMRAKGKYNAVSEAFTKYGCMISDDKGNMIGMVRPHCELSDEEMSRALQVEKSYELNNKVNEEAKEMEKQGIPKEDIEKALTEKYMAVFTGINNDDISVFKTLSDELKAAKEGNDDKKLEEIRAKIETEKKSMEEKSAKKLQEDLKSSSYVHHLKELQEAVNSADEPTLTNKIDDLTKMGYKVGRAVAFFNADGSYNPETFRNIPLEEGSRTRAFYDVAKAAIKENDLEAMNSLKDQLEKYSEELLTITESQAEAFGVTLTQKMLQEYEVPELKTEKGDVIDRNADFTKEKRDFYCKTLEKKVASAGFRAKDYKHARDTSETQEEFEEKLREKGIKYQRVYDAESSSSVSENLVKLGYNPMDTSEAHADMPELKKRILSYNKDLSDRMQDENLKDLIDEEPLILDDCLFPMNGYRMKIDLRYRAHLPEFISVVKKHGPEKAFKIMTEAESIDEVKQYA